MGKLEAKTMKELQEEVRAEMKRRCGYGSLEEFARDVVDLEEGGAITAVQGTNIIEPLIQVNDTENMRRPPIEGEPIHFDMQSEASEFIEKLKNEPMVGSESSCRAMCSGLCVSTCTSSCTGCSGCTGSCGSNCSDGCSTQCSGTCAVNCGATCGATCINGCANGCKNGCIGSCTGCSSCGGCAGCTGCGTGCDQSCTSCVGSCKNACSGCTGCGGCAGVSG